MILYNEADIGLDEPQTVPGDTSEPQPVQYDPVAKTEAGGCGPYSIPEAAPPPYPQFSFSLALNFLKEGGSVARVGWNGKGLRVSAQFPTINSWMTLPYLYIEYPDGRRWPWLASQTDIMSDDWHHF